jgi:MFS family permease
MSAQNPSVTFQVTPGYWIHRLHAIFRSRWWIVFASILGLIVGFGSIVVFAFSVFLKPISEDLGLSRSALSSAFTIATVANGIACPFVGLLVDRWGCRRIMLPGIAVFALSVAACSLLQSSPFVVYVLFAIVGLFGSVQQPISYTTAISKWFDRERGLALGLATAVVGLGMAIVPPIAGVLIQNFGWRTAYVGLGAAILLAAFLPVAIFVRDPEQTQQSSRRPSSELPGITATSAIKNSWRFWFLNLAFLLGVIAINGTLTHIIPLLSDHGISFQLATSIFSGAGMAMIFGRVFVGYCLDRFFGPHVAICFFVAPMAGIALLANGTTSSILFFGTLLCGLGIGAVTGLMTYFASRYFGLRAYGTIVGLMFAIFQIGVGLGAYLSAVSFDLWHSYRPAFGVFEIALLTSCILFYPLGPYPFPARACSRECQKESESA